MADLRACFDTGLGLEVPVWRPRRSTMHTLDMLNTKTILYFGQKREIQMKVMDAQDILVDCGGEMGAGARTHFVPAVLAPSARDAGKASVRDAFHHHSSTRHQCSPLSISSDIVIQQDRRRQRLLCRRIDRTRPFLLCGSSRAERVRFCDLTVRRSPAIEYSLDNAQSLNAKV